MARARHFICDGVFRRMPGRALAHHDLQLREYRVPGSRHETQEAAVGRSTPRDEALGEERAPVAQGDSWGAGHSWFNYFEGWT